jgi:hypothetical protein
MPWTVQIEDEDGCPQSDIRLVIEFTLVFSLPDFEFLPSVATSSLLKYLDPWGNAVFNRLQMGDLRREWTALTPAGGEIASWNAVTEMIDICGSTKHCYLRFVGD